MKEVLLTKTALEKVQRELDEQIAKRKLISEEIKKAREFGDLSENAEYHAAREAQSLNETEILKLRAILENARLVSEDENGTNRVSMNSRIRVLYVEEKLEEIMTIVSTIESDPFSGMISNDSPIGIALLGKTEGDTVEAITPNGTITLKVLEILH